MLGAARFGFSGGKEFMDASGGSTSTYTESGKNYKAHSFTSSSNFVLNSLVDGVSAVVPPEEDNPRGHPVVVSNKFETSKGYSGNAYDVDSATQNGVIYPSLDPSIFELKFPGTDIEGRVVGDSSGGN